MTDKELQKIAGIIFEKILEHQKEYDDELKKEISMILDDKLSKKDISEELSYLEERLNYLLSKELYEEASIIQRKIDFIKNKIQE